MRKLEGSKPSTARSVMDAYRSCTRQACCLTRAGAIEITGRRRVLQLLHEATLVQSRDHDESSRHARDIVAPPLPGRRTFGLR
ncbi:hypothetical protein L0Z14_19070 [Burkholderia multivorans]|uniref:hypothetical protein n=1 Tax=Burkholderia multivorans TaxID=87883 RepID=UPI00201AA001|nr:hypothetical protein [Burkholderia multivorans]MCL4663026.1 hypothetical protein [Burkholderia multivorans]